MDNNNNDNPEKKRKANDGSATMPDGAHDVNNTNNNSIDGGGFLSYISGRGDGASSGPPSAEQFIHQSMSHQMERMEKIMMRMEEKLAHMSSLESRCEQLEAKCSSLENKLETTSQSIKEHFDSKIDSLHLHLEQKCDSLVNRLETKVDSVHVKVDKSLKFHEYNEMLTKNQSWEYSAPVIEKDDWLFDNEYSEDEAEYLAYTAEDLKRLTLTMRQGEFPHENLLQREGKGIYFEMNDSDPPFSHAVNDELLPHWKEFAAALKQFSPAINLLLMTARVFLVFTMSS